MPRIRPFRASDLEAVGALLATNLPPPLPEPSFLESTLLDPAWRDDDVTSLVAEEDGGALVGFIGVQPRHLRFDDRELRAACCSHLVVDAGARRTAAGVLLLRKVVTGPQELTFSDTATPVVTRIWQALGGRPDHARSLDWLTVLRPLRWAGAVGAGIARRVPLWRDLLPAGAVPAQGLAGRGGASVDDDVRSEPVTPERIAAEEPAILDGVRLRAVHDAAFLEHMFRWLGPQGLVTRLVRRGDQPVGWYAYILRPGRTSRVLHLAAAERNVEATLAELTAHARESGSAALAGRVEPRLNDALRTRSPALGFARAPLVHSRDPELLAALETSGALLSQLDGEWFLT